VFITTESKKTRMIQFPVLYAQSAGLIMVNCRIYEKKPTNKLNYT